MYDLTLFFTKNTSLADWERGGMFEREVALYRKLVQRGVKVRFVTYGDNRDLNYRPSLAGIDLVCNRWRLPPRLYLAYLTYLAPFLWPQVAVFKSNQLKGAEIGLQAAKRFGHCFVARCGYLYAWTIAQQNGSDSPQAQQARQLELSVFSGADQVVVTTYEMRDAVLSSYNITPAKVRVIPNYVEIERFTPLPGIARSPKRIFFVGRLEKEKNLPALLDAVVGLDVELYLAGNGTQKDALFRQAAAERLNVHFLGMVANEELPALMNQAAVFILPSYYEGHPKTLLEAMSCGIPVIGTDVPGIRGIIRHGENGWLCGTGTAQIRQALQNVLDDPTLQERLGVNARQTVLDRFSLDRIVELELALLQEMSQ